MSLVSYRRRLVPRHMIKLLEGARRSSVQKPPCRQQQPRGIRRRKGICAPLLPAKHNKRELSTNIGEDFAPKSAIAGVQLRAAILSVYANNARTELTC